MGFLSRGVALKEQLNLMSFPEVKICRVIKEASIKIFLVLYNSRSPFRKITNRSLRKEPKFLNFITISESGAEESTLTPLVDIENFSGSASTALFIKLDLSGVFQKDFSESVAPSKDLISFSGRLSIIREWLTIKNLMNGQGQDDFNKPFEAERKGLMGGANTNTKLISVDFDKNMDPVFSFLTEATEKYPKDHLFKEVDPVTFELVNNPSKTYTLQLKVVDFQKWLDTYPDKTIITKKDILDILDVSFVQLWNSSPSLQYQGRNYFLTQMDAAIYPTDIKPKIWDKKVGDMAFTDKHLTALLRSGSIEFFSQQMASMLTKKCKEEGLI